MENYKEWVDNEYQLWEEALSFCMEDSGAFDTFKSLPQIQRMVGVSNFEGVFLDLVKDIDAPWEEIEKLDSVGAPPSTESINGFNISTITLRYLYYANKVLNELGNAKRIVEIGAGYGGFCSILNCLALHRKISIDEYSIYDRKKVQAFQSYYLKKILRSNEFGIKNVFFPNPLDLEQSLNRIDFCVSFYALGEFDKETKHNYINKIVSKVDNGYIIWNPHTASDPDGELLLLKYHPKLRKTEEFPLTSPYNLEIKLR